MERIVIVAYKPLTGKHKALEELMLKHWKILAGQKLVSDRQPIIMKASDGTFIEVFGWRSAEAMGEAHSNPEVLKMWDEYASVCEYVPIGSLEESNNLFSEFEPVNQP